MRLPEVNTVLRDRPRNVTYVVKAYRTLSRAEAVRVLRAFLARPGVKRPGPNSTCDIITTIGARNAT